MDYYVLRLLEILTICTAVAQGKLDWSVYKKISAYGEEITLFCSVENCCSEPAGWTKQYLTHYSEPIFLNVKSIPYNSTSKYDGRIGLDGFYLFIRNVSKQDLEIEYICSYGFSLSPPKFLREYMVFKGFTSDLPATTVKQENDLTLKIAIPTICAVFLVVFVVIVAIIIWRTRNRNKYPDRDYNSTQMENEGHLPVKELMDANTNLERNGDGLHNSSNQNRDTEDVNYPEITRTICETCNLKTATKERKVTVSASASDVANKKEMENFSRTISANEPLFAGKPLNSSSKSETAPVKIQIHQLRGSNNSGTSVRQDDSGSIHITVGSGSFKSVDSLEEEAETLLQQQ